MDRLSSQRPFAKKGDEKPTHSRQRTKNKPDLSTIEGSRQFILQQDKKKRKKTHNIGEAWDPTQEQGEETSLTSKYRDRAKERRLGIAENQNGESGTLLQDQTTFSPLVKGLDYSVLKRDTKIGQTFHSATVKETSSEVQPQKQQLDNISAQVHWPSTVAKIAILQFPKEPTQTNKGRRVDSFHPGRMFYVYELVKQGLNQSDQPLVIRHSKKNISPSNSVVYEWNQDIASLLWAQDKKDKLASLPTEDCFQANKGNSEIRLIWNCKRPLKHQYSSTSQEAEDSTATPNNITKRTSELQGDDEEIRDAIKEENETTKDIHCPAIQKESDTEEEVMDIFQDIDPTKVSWNYHNT